MPKPKDENLEALVEKVRGPGWGLDDPRGERQAALDAILAECAKWRKLYGQAFNDADKARERCKVAEKECNEERALRERLMLAVGAKFAQEALDEMPPHIEATMDENEIWLRRHFGRG